jgi:Flp pilus assembly secretin CpaC
MRIHFLSIALIVALISISANAEQLPEPHTIALERNVEKFLTIDFPIRRLTIGNAEIVDVSIVDGKTLRLLGLASGTTNFSLWRNNSGEPDVFTVFRRGRGGGSHRQA